MVVSQSNIVNATRGYSLTRGFQSANGVFGYCKTCNAFRKSISPLKKG